MSDDELAASIDLDGDNDTEDENDPLHTSTTNQSLPSRWRVSQRLPGKHDILNNATVQPKQQVKGTPYNDIGWMNLANIITGKCKHFHIDYRKLNDAMLHLVPDNELDDDDDDDDDDFI